MTFFSKALYGIVLIAFVLRLYNISAPLADWHSFRQADTASVTREYVKHGIDLLRPRYHDLSNVQSGVLTGGKDNLEGWRMVEFPIVNGVIAAVIRAAPSLDLVITSRVFSIAASLMTLVAVGVLGKQIYGEKVGLTSAAVFAVLPFSVFYGRTILPEPFLLATVTWSLVCFLFYEKTRFKVQGSGFRSTQGLVFLIFSMILFSLALLIKPMAIFFVPAFVGIVLWRRGIKGLLDLPVIGLGLASIVPLLWWREWIKQFPTGIPWSVWLYNLDRIRLRPAWWRWLFWERLTKLWLGFSGVIFLGVSGLSIMYELRLGIGKFIRSRHIVLTLWGLGMFVYLVIFATGNVRHDYYQIMILPLISLLVGQGLTSLWLIEEGKRETVKGKSLPTVVMRSVVIGLCVIALYFSWTRVQGYYAINHPEIIEAGQAVDRLLPQDAKVIVPYNGDTAFLFQTNRTGWPVGFDIDQKIANGAQYYVSVNYDDEARELEKNYPAVEKTDDYIILNLRERL